MSEELQELINAPMVLPPNEDLLKDWQERHPDKPEPWALMADREYTALTWQFLMPAKSHILFSFQLRILLLMAEKAREEAERIEQVEALLNKVDAEPVSVAASP